MTDVPRFVVGSQEERAKGVRGTGFYSGKKWLEVRDYVRHRDENTCRSCGNPVTERYIVDHIIEVTVDNVHDWDIAYNPDNLQLLCQTCHNAKTFSKETKAQSLW